MEIRHAKFTDLKRLIPLFIQAHAQSRYSDVPMDVGMAERVFRQAMMSSESPQVGGFVVFVVEQDAKIVGFLAGQLDLLYTCLDMAIAQNILFFVQKDAPPRAADKLIKAFEDWAFQWDGRVLLRLYVTDAIVRADHLAIWLNRKGLRHCGYAFEKEK